MSINGDNFLKMNNNTKDITPKLVDPGYSIQKNEGNSEKSHSCNDKRLNTLLGPHWKCTQDPKSDVELNSESRLKIHSILYKNATKPFKCQQCDLTFDRCSQLDYHRRSVHLGEKSQICQICGKGFFRKTDLRTHLNIHLGTNLCVCEICGRKFNHVSNLIRHCRMHAGLKPYPCSICGKRFTQISSLGRHKRIHEKNNSVSQLASSSCSINHTSSKLDGSVEGSMPENRKIMKRQHYCRICGESFHSVLLLRNHEKFHTNNTEPMECKNCGKTFQKINDIKEHRCEASINKLKIDKSTHKQRKNANNKLKVKVKDHELSNISKNNPNDDSDVYKISEQLRRNDFENGSDTSNPSFQEYLFEIDGTCTNVSLGNDVGLNISTISNQLDCDQIKLIDSCQTEREYVEFHKNVEEKSFLDICKQLNVNIIQEKRRNKSLNVNENSLEMCISESNPVHLNGIFDKTQFPFHIEDVVTITQENQEDSSKSSNDEPFGNSIDGNALSSDNEPTLRLVQTETGEQFYELILNNFLDKVSNNQFTKSHCDKTTLDETITIPEKLNSSIKDVQSEEDLRNFNTNNEFDNVQHILSDMVKNFDDLHRDEKEQCFYISAKNKAYQNHISEKEIQSIHSLNLNFLENDSHSDFEQYVATNFESFEKSNYENSNEPCLEFIKIAEINQENLISKFCPTVHLEPNEDNQPNLDNDPLEFSKNHKKKFDIMNESIQNEMSNNTKINSTTIVYTTDQTDIFKENDSTSMKILQQKDQKHEKKTLSSNESVKNQTDNNYKSLEAKKLNNSIKTYQCSECKKVFSNGYNFKQHMGTHFTDQQKFSCTECGVFFAWKSTLNKHMANNHRPDGRKKFICELCPKVYGTLSQVNEHVKRDHLKQRNHVCSYCGKCFFKKFDLKTHSRMHTDERPYVCLVCGKRFYHQSHIIRHERIHSGERPYSCEICQKTFTQPGSLKIHKQKHQQSKPDIIDDPIDEDDPLKI